MATNTDDDCNFAGKVNFSGSVGFPVGCVGDPQVNPSSPIDVTKLRHRHNITSSQVQGVAAVTERRVVHRARAAGTVTSFYAGLTVVCTGAATLTFDVLRNGTTMLSAPLVIGNAVAAYNSLPGSLIASPVYAAGDVIEVVLTATAGGGGLGQGAFSALVLTEGA